MNQDEIKIQKKRERQMKIKKYQESLKSFSDEIHSLLEKIRDKYSPSSLRLTDYLKAYLYHLYQYRIVFDRYTRSRYSDYHTYSCCRGIELKNEYKYTPIPEPGEYKPMNSETEITPSEIEKIITNFKNDTHVYEEQDSAKTILYKTSIDYITLTYLLLSPIYNRDPYDNYFLCFPDNFRYDVIKFLKKIISDAHKKPKNIFQNAGKQTCHQIFKSAREEFYKISIPCKKY